MVEYVLILIVICLLRMTYQIDQIADRMREHFPTEKESDYDWAIKDPAGYVGARKG